MENITNFRKHLHANPELSGLEKKTNKYVIDALKKLGITTIHQGFSMYSFIAEIYGKESGSTLLFRCELDALPIQETNNLPYRSIHEGISHKCGHDGHLAGTCGLCSLSCSCCSRSIRRSAATKPHLLHSIEIRTSFGSATTSRLTAITPPSPSSPFRS